MSRTSRLLDLMQRLRRHRQAVSGAKLCAELGISLRTLYRDIATLQAQGAAIDGAPGLGYLLRPGFTLPPLMFSTEEVEALVLGSRWVAERADSRLADAARNAMAKIAAVVPPALAYELESSALLVGPAKPPAAGDLELVALRQAIRLEQRLQISYRDAKGETTERQVWPIALGYFDRVQVLVAWCELRQDLRHFRTDRMAALTSLGQRYPRRRAALLDDWRRQQKITNTADRN